MTCNIVDDTLGFQKQTQRSVPPKSFEETKPIASAVCSGARLSSAFEYTKRAWKVFTRDCMTSRS